MFEIGSHFIPSDENSEMWLSFVYRGIKKRRATVLLAQKGRKPIGFIHLTYPENERYQTFLRFATIHEIYVDPTHRGLGVGTQLMVKALKKIKEKGFAHVKLSVLSSNLGGVQFYKKFGFEVYRYGMLKELF